ncbi:hypothetical protein [Hansschlegelia sp. KR7-227]|uniref:hypothetical protein n=1 Tax=Hansschlegelia sp. KR7-227 TaxID=3400914 RepID=UPI003C085AAC
MRSILKLVFGNLLVLAGLWLGVLLLLSVGIDLYDLARSLVGKTYKRAEVAAYTDHARAQQIHVDQKDSIKTYAPFIEWRQSGKASETLNIGPDGYRTHRIGRDAGPEAPEIGFFGGSTVWGTGVDDDGTIPAQFDDLTTGVRVANYGERGFSTMQNLIELMTLMNRDVAPKTVVFYEGFNDVWVHCNRAVTDRLNSHTEERRLQAAIDRSDDENFAWNNLVAPMITMIGRLIDVDDRKSLPGCSADPVRAEAVAEMMMRNWEMAERLVTGYGGTFRLVLQPTAFTGKPRVDHLDLSDPRDRALGVELNTIYPIVRKKLAERAAAWSTDLTDALDGDGMLLIDHVHLATPGNRLIAQKIKAALDGSQAAAAQPEERTGAADRAARPAGSDEPGR